MEKERRLRDWLRARNAVAIGYSGGVDSSYLLAVAVGELGAANVLPIIGRSASYPAAQWEAAHDTARTLNVDVVEIETDELADPRYAANPSNRCYFCKTVLWSKLVPAAAARGIGVVVDGTNADDLLGHRPGAAAATEHGVLSPLAELGFSKAEVRAGARKLGLAISEQPSSPCLSSRIPYGTPVTVSRLKRVERAEAALRALGVAGDLRVRHYGELARVEIGAQELGRWSSSPARQQLERAVLESGYSRVEIDPNGYRSGSLNA